MLEYIGSRDFGHMPPPLPEFVDVGALDGIASDFFHLYAQIQDGAAAITWLEVHTDSLSVRVCRMARKEGTLLAVFGMAFVPVLTCFDDPAGFEIQSEPLDQLALAGSRLCVQGIGVPR